ncbi:MAG: Unknown protein [uncultured Sulfurovum sp.]|uniref:Uncharacterized protein n=1 Tax=uncultured Sulfurovum sp. TaxID=269237 RepID=A0A6S6SU49_9BACT|nr:MAG: Unknown protein [uncultured Sulfurovum sp.]
MKTLLKSILFLLVLSQILLATTDYILDTYIPIANPQAELEDKDGIKLYKVPFYTFYSYSESAIGSVTWEYLVNTPHGNLKNTDINLANIEGLKVEVDYASGNNCTVFIDSKNVVHDYTSNDFEKILDYVKKATQLNLKNAKLNCNIEEKHLAMHDNLPKPLLLQSVVDSTFSDYKLGRSKLHFLYDNVYLLGKSKTKIAYAIEYDTDPADLVRIETFIQDLVNDEIVWKDTYQKDSHTNKVNFSIYWRAKKGLIAQTLQDYKLKPFSKPTLQRGAIHYKNDVLNLKASSKKSWSKDWSSDFLEQSSVFLDSKLEGNKRVDFQKYQFPSHILDRKPIGYIRLDENNQRIAIVVAKVQRGWEGPPHNIHYEFVGANLRIGFK